ncbi:YibE/F family protein [Kribbella antibiotica]|uniref:YibE/F family protein n=1 Tax=Kribbella antibiotica TaxID=190195 RepID=UPI001EDE2F22|nr:YibE/F family protein [Kribbella antibiotica]
MSHGHGDTSAVDADAVVARRVRILLAAVLTPLLLLTLVGVVMLWPSHEVKVDALQTAKARGVVLSIAPCAERPDECDRARVKVTAGEGTGSEVDARVVKHPLVPRVQAGNRILMQVIPEAAADERYKYVDQDRGRPLLLLVGIFAAAVIALSRWRGLAALGALAVTAVVLTQFVMPAILAGGDPLLVAVVGAFVIMSVTLLLTHGPNAQTAISMAGTAGALVLTAALGELFVLGSRISGLDNNGASEVAAYVPGGVNLPSLVVAGLVIGALGVLDDVTVTQTAAVWELSAAKPNASRRELLAAGLRIGRSHVASVVNTLVLAYAGAALPLLMLFAITGTPDSYVVSLETVATQIVNGLVGSLGIIAAVPLTTALAAAAVAHRSGSVPSPRDAVDAG